MPDTRLSGSEGLDQYRRRLSAWLHANLGDVRSLSDRDIQPYREIGKGVVAGWEVQSADSGHRFLVLVDEAFPFSKIQIAYMSEENRYLQWPHVEEHGFMCLPSPNWLPCEKLGPSIQESLQQAEKLISDCQSDTFIRNESQREFVTYWRRHSEVPARSLIDVTNRNTRVVCVRYIDGRTLVGESDDQLETWTERTGGLQSGRSAQGVFAFIEDAPFLPFPQNALQFFDQLVGQASGIDKCLAKLSPFQDTLIILASSVRGGIGLWGGRLQAAPSHGFRRSCSPRIAKSVWRRYCPYKPVAITRVDGSWVHGRDRDMHYSQLSQRRVVLLGAGSLGSQVASRLAQAGIGHIDMIDPEVLDACNVGRHELGMDSAGTKKVEALARNLSEKYPHGEYRGFPQKWQAVLRDSPEVFEEADLVVCCMGETPQDLAWNAFHQAGDLLATSLYGWLGTQGATGHALALSPSGPGLSCFIDPGGFIKRPDTDFAEGDQLQSEPGCGTEFQPYGPLSAGQVELLVSRMAIDLLSGKVAVPSHRIRTCSSEELNELGGQWTEAHLDQRPDGYEGPLQYELPVASCGECYRCAEGE